MPTGEKGGMHAVPDSSEMIIANGVKLCVEALGASDDPSILLIHGAASPMHGWHDDFCAQLVAGGRYVVRYDQRDTGRSVSYPPGQPGYSLPDLIVDGVGILDALDIEVAHVVGTSMGGGIALGMALDYPERVASLTLIATSAGGPDLPPMSADFLAFISNSEQPDWSDRQAVLDHIVGFFRVLEGDLDPEAEAEMRAQLGFSLDRTTNIASSQINHFAMEAGEPVRGRLHELALPTLVIHGANDPVFPPGHGEVLASEIPGAEFILMDDAGHLLLPATWETIVPALLAHTSR